MIRIFGGKTIDRMGKGNHMIRQIVKDTFFLSQKSEDAGKEDLYIADDLTDTLQANKDRCVGMAANMIGQRKKIIVVDMGLFPLIMINPEIISKSGPYETEEGCLSLTGVRPVTRYQKIKVVWLDRNFQKQTQEFAGRSAQIIQHEIDHFSGRLI